MGTKSERVPSPAVPGWHEGWFVVPHEVTWQDVDGMGHVNNAVYFQYFEWARTKYWFTLHGTREIEALEFIVARAECDFRAELRLLDHIDICVRIGEMRNSSLDFQYEVRRREDGTVAATGMVVVVLYSWKNGHKLQIDDDFRKRIERFERGG